MSYLTQYSQNIIILINNECKIIKEIFYVLLLYCLWNRHIIYTFSTFQLGPATFHILNSGLYVGRNISTEILSLKIGVKCYRWTV